jgi:hypothetical protein
MSKKPKFTLFPKLAIELRLEVWKLACFESRIVDLWTVKIPETAPRYYRYRSYSTVPILHTCKEAREVGLQHYSSEFGVEFIKSSSGTSTTIFPELAIPHIYINWDLDIICLVNPLPDRMINDISKGQFPIRHLALDTTRLRHGCLTKALNLPLTQLIICNTPSDFSSHKFTTQRSMSVELELGRTNESATNSLDKSVFKEMESVRRTIGAFECTVKYVKEARSLMRVGWEATPVEGGRLQVKKLGSESR